MSAGDMIERVARAIDPWAFSRDGPLDYDYWAMKQRRTTARQNAQRVVKAIREPTEAMWGGLARDLVTWDRFRRPSGTTLCQHLRSSGREIPAWLLAEIPETDHVPPKGTVAVCIFKAMIDAALASGDGAK